MRAKSVKNITNGRVRVRFTSGMSANLLPGSTIENVEISNEDELKGRVHIVGDLTEVNENSGKQRLDG